ncbi:hypothetical protein [Microbacterium sp. 179-I 3D4 NHS]|uniref:hypothetical protein n=1 Tax=Microbacterium sp. 179-I 3D4 NHS TaxID=3142381 RepID=UPI0039A3B04F
MKIRHSIEKVLLAAIVVTGSVLGAAPASASPSSTSSATASAAIGARTDTALARLRSNASCSSLYLTGVLSNGTIVGSCRPANPRAGARIKLTVTCNYIAPYRHDVYVTLHHGGSFRVNSGCLGFGTWNLTYSRTWVG